MKKIYSVLSAMLVFAGSMSAATNMAYHKEGRTSITSLSEERLYVSDEILNPDHDNAVKTDAESYSVGAWVKVDKVAAVNNASNNSVILGYRTRAHINDNGAWHVVVDKDGKIAVTGWGTQCGKFATDTDMPIGEWAHIMAVYNSDDLTFTIYLNGEAIAEKTLSAKIKFQDEVQAFEFAGWQFGGDLDDATIYNKALTAEEVATSMQKPAKVDGLAAYYTFEETIEGTNTQFANQSTQECAKDVNLICETGTAMDAAHVWSNGLVYLVICSECPYTNNLYGTMAETVPTLVEGREIPVKEEITVTINETDGGFVEVYTDYDWYDQVMSGETLSLSQLTDGLYFVPWTNDNYTLEALMVNDVNVKDQMEEDELYYHMTEVDDDVICYGVYTSDLAGIGEVAIDFTAEVEFFNLQGVRVDSSNLTNGVYVARQGDKAVKVLIRK